MAVISTLVGALAVLGAAAPVHAYTGGVPETTEVAPGGTIVAAFATPLTEGTEVFFTLTGENVTGVTLASTVEATGVVGAGGAVSVSLTIPASARPGSVFELTVSGDDGVNEYSETRIYTVAGVPGDGVTSEDDLAETGGVDATWIAWFGGGFVLLGIMCIVIVGRARRRAQG